jgi:hypothetical protein
MSLENVRKLINFSRQFIGDGNIFVDYMMTASTDRNV